MSAPLSTATTALDSSFKGTSQPRTWTRPKWWFFKNKSATLNWSQHQKELMYYFGGAILFFVLIYVLKHCFKETYEPSALNGYFKGPKQLPKVKGESKGETLCRDAAQRIFGKPFIKVRPKFLKNNVTGHNLELDIYNEDLKLAIEYNGQQHYKYVPFFHKNYEAFQNQRYRDEIKKMLCQQQGIHLIEISYETDPKDIDTIIRLEARRLGYNV